MGLMRPRHRKPLSAMQRQGRNYSPGSTKQKRYRSWAQPTTLTLKWGQLCCSSSHTRG